MCAVILDLDAISFFCNVLLSIFPAVISRIFFDTGDTQGVLRLEFELMFILLGFLFGR